MCSCTKNKSPGAFVCMSFFHMWAWLPQETGFILLPFASTFKFFQNKCMRMHGINDGLVHLFTLSPPQSLVKYNYILTSGFKEMR